MARYIDGFVLPVPKKKLDQYRRIARKAGKVWCEHGALEYVEAVEDDRATAEFTSFPDAIKAKRGEVVVFSFIVYRSRAHRDRVNKKAMNDPRLAAFTEGNVPFEPRRMAWAGFKSIVDQFPAQD